VTTLAQRLPDLESLLREAGRPDLAEQVPHLEVGQPCECSVESCQSFHVAGAKPMKRYFRRGKDVPVGDYVLNTIDGEIVYVEVLGSG
jgi:hypothetical protein